MDDIQCVCESFEEEEEVMMIMLGMMMTIEM